jgi:hypothetical protein
MRLEKKSATEGTKLQETFEMPILTLWERTAQLLGHVGGDGTESQTERSEELELKIRIESFLERYKELNRDSKETSREYIEFFASGSMGTGSNAGPRTGGEGEDGGEGGEGKETRCSIQL